MQNNKDTIRKRAIKLRSVLTPSEVNGRSSLVLQNLAPISGKPSISNIMCYLDFNNEVKTCGFINQCLSVGKKIFIPYIDSLHNQISFCEISDVKAETLPGKFGILEPKQHLRSTVLPSILDMVIVPGLAFDYSLNRIGYGKGYYDCFLKSVKPSCLKIGLAFDLQMVERIPISENDIPMDFVVTETNILSKKDND